jgi:hypothetical protein
MTIEAIIQASEIASIRKEVIIDEDFLVKKRGELVLWQELDAGCE